jgi:hypothetical protein
MYGVVGEETNRQVCLPTRRRPTRTDGSSLHYERYRHVCTIRSASRRRGHNAEEG